MARATSCRSTCVAELGVTERRRADSPSYAPYERAGDEVMSIAVASLSLRLQAPRAIGSILLRGTAQIVRQPTCRPEEKFRRSPAKLGLAAADVGQTVCCGLLVR